MIYGRAFESEVYMISKFLLIFMLVLGSATICWTDGINTYCQNSQTKETSYFLNTVP